ncbi:tyrosine-type recombinase/integrase [Bradyrhizobium sp. URHC0002]
MTEIADNDAAKMVAWRRGQHVKGSKALVAPATVNRSTTEVLKKLFTFAKGEGVRFEHEPKWKSHFLKEPEERVRELQDHEGDAIDAAMRDDYRPLFDFVAASGWRQGAAVELKWSEVNFGTKTITKLGKGGKRITLKITPSIHAILWPLQGHHPEAVFTYIAEKTIKPREIIRGQRYPMTISGVKTRWRRTRTDAGVTDFRFHDFRHDFATKLLRGTGNLKLVQKALGHANLKTTSKYAHVLEDEVADAIEQLNLSRGNRQAVFDKAS